MTEQEREQAELYAAGEAAEAEAKNKTEQELTAKYAKTVANLMLNVKDMDWLVKNDKTEKTTKFLSYLADGIELGYLPPSIAKVALTAYIKMQQGMVKHD